MNLEPYDLVGTSEISLRTAHGIGTVHHWLKRYDDFPQPFVSLQGPGGKHRIWYWPDVERWLRATNRWTDLRNPTGEVEKVEKVEIESAA